MFFNHRKLIASAVKLMDRPPQSRISTLLMRWEIILTENEKTSKENHWNVLQQAWTTITKEYLKVA